MLTRCPACGSTFRVSAEQLKAKAGRVRCGVCAAAFNALDNLQDMPAETQPQAPVATQQPLPDALVLTADITAPAPGDVETAPVTHQSTAALQDTASVFSPDSNENSPAIITAITAANPPEKNPPATPPQLPPTGAPASPQPIQPPQDNILLDGSLIPLDALQLKTATRGRHGLWITGCVLMVVALILQGIVAFHAQLSRSLPVTKPLVARLCQQLNCPTRLPAQASLIGIESSDLHPAPDQPEHLTVSATIKNRANFAQQFPHLELTLTDINDKVVLRKVLPPATYLPAKTSVAQGMPALADISVNLVVAIQPLTASGYRLYLFYP